MSVFKKLKREKNNSLNEFFRIAMRGSFRVAKETK